MTTRIGDSNLIFGMTDEPYGYMEGETVDHTPTFTEAENGQSEVVAGEFSHDMKTVTGTYIWRNVSGDPAAEVGSGSTITLLNSGLTIYIMTASTVFAKGEWKKINFEGTYYPSLGS